jgi:hypothetical protein
MKDLNCNLSEAFPRFSGTGWKGMAGGREGIRTLDLSVANAALSQLSYAPNH